ncbi:MAG: hypothetical protein RBS24_06090 [Bacilli bacterium]|nr:hypothetical protein [Bacilli bacterium]
MYLEYFDKGKKQKAQIKDASKKDLKQWQRDVMPFEKSQAAKWNWETFLVREYRLARMTGQAPKFISLSVNNTPVGMMLLVNNFKAHVNHGKKENLTHVWYIQSAPADYLKKHNINKSTFDLSIGRVLLDAAVVNSMKSGNDGKTMLHADPGGKDFLMEYYTKQGFTNIKDGRIKQISSFRDNDGRYFFMNKAAAEIFTFSNRQKIGQKLTIEKPQKKENQQSISF